jgi:Cyclin, N-terminal domain
VVTRLLAAGAGGAKLKALRLDEETKLLRYYQAKVQDVCRGFRFPGKVAATALMMFKRFYLAFSALDHDPKNIMLTAIYLACKATPVDDPSVPRMPPADLVELR